MRQSFFRRPAALAGLVFASVALAGLGWAATSRVLAAGEPPSPAGRAFSAAARSLGAVGVWMGWPLVRRDQWWLDRRADQRARPSVTLLAGEEMVRWRAQVRVGLVAMHAEPVAVPWDGQVDVASGTATRRSV